MLKRMTKPRRPFLLGYSLVIFTCLYVPLIVLSASSFRGGPTLFHWYEQAFSNPQLLLSIRNSMIIGLGTTVFSTLLGTLAALGLHKMGGKDSFWSKVLFESLLNL